MFEGVGERTREWQTIFITKGGSRRQQCERNEKGHFEASPRDCRCETGFTYRMVYGHERATGSSSARALSHWQ